MYRHRVFSRLIVDDAAELREIDFGSVGGVGVQRRLAAIAMDVDPLSLEDKRLNLGD